MATYIDVHILQTIPPANINRDDTGSPKSAVFGGVRRARVSSQAWKRATRTEFNSHLDQSGLGVRTLRIVEQIAAEISARQPDLSDRAAELAAGVVTAAGIKLAKPKKAAASDASAGEGASTASGEALAGYLIFLSRAQIVALADLAIDSADGSPSKKDAKAAFTDQNSIDVALFGRMIADAPDLNVDACCQVAQALSVHAATTEFDYFTAVDDKAPEDNAGAGMIGTIEYVSSTLYRYANINAEELARSLGSADAAARAIEAFVKAFAVSMPTGKSNTFANRTRPDLVLVTVRDDQPVNLVGAFEDAIDTTHGRTAEATRRLVDHARGQDEAFGTAPVAGVFLAAGGAAEPEPLAALESIAARGTLESVASTAAKTVLDRVH